MFHFDWNVPSFKTMLNTFNFSRYGQPLQKQPLQAKCKPKQWASNLWLQEFGILVPRRRPKSMLKKLLLAPKTGYLSIRIHFWGSTNLRWKVVVLDFSIARTNSLSITIVNMKRQPIFDCTQKCISRRISRLKRRY